MGLGEGAGREQGRLNSAGLQFQRSAGWRHRTLTSARLMEGRLLAKVASATDCPSSLPVRVLRSRRRLGAAWAATSRHHVGTRGFPPVCRSGVSDCSETACLKSRRGDIQPPWLSVSSPTGGMPQLMEIKSLRRACPVSLEPYQGLVAALGSSCRMPISNATTAYYSNGAGDRDRTDDIQLGNCGGG